MPSKIVVVESPFSGNERKNREYAQRACRDCIERGEIPFASHLLYPQILSDLDPIERAIGIGMGYAFWTLASKIVFYMDWGESPGMTRARERARFLGYIDENRYLL